MSTTTLQPSVSRKTTLTSRERVIRALERRDHDRVPRHESFWGDTIKRWEGEGLIGGERTVRQELEDDFHGVCWCWPSPYGKTETIREEETCKIVRDPFGATLREWKNRTGTPEHLGFECDTSEKWHTKFKPMLLDFGVTAGEKEHARKQYRAGLEKKAFTFICGVEPFEMTRKLMGDEISMMAFVEEPEWLADVSRVFTEVTLKSYDALLDTGIQPDCLWIYGDMAYKVSTMCSPAQYREIIWPYHKMQADWAKARGMKLIYHTDGNVNDVIDLYIAAGFDALQPLEVKAGMDVRKLFPKYGDRLSFFGNIDVMIMIEENLEKIEAEIVSKFAAGKAKNGYIYHSDHSVPPQVSLEFYRKIIGVVNQYGWY